MRKDILLAILFCGLLLVAVAVWADVLGLDRAGGWGRARIAVLLLGVVFLLLAGAYAMWADRISVVARKAVDFLEKSRFPGPMVSRYSFVFPWLVLVILIYVWFISSGTWTTWVSPTRYYADLARGFRNGNLYVPSRPPPELVALPDPYDYRARHQAGIQVPIDMSYYKGRYYLYWGPVPALLLTAIYPLYPLRVGDLQLVFAFVSGTFLLQSFLAVSIWARGLSNLPKWLLVLSILVIGLSSPVTFMLANQIAARIYEAAVTGAQFFLMGGLLVAFAALNGPLSAWKLILAGLLWGLALGTRQTVLTAVCVMVLMVVLAVLQRKEASASQRIGNLAALLVPLVVSVICLGWYNWARFGSVTETGLYYQMNYGFVHYHTRELFDSRYIPQNLYNYLLMPFEVQPEFPFLQPALGGREWLFSSTPSIYNAQLITGLLCTVPFVVFAVFSLLAFRRSSILHQEEPRLIQWAVGTLGGASLASLGVLVFFFWAAMRYAYDFTPSLILLSVIGFWQGYSFLSSKPFPRKVYAAAGASLVVASIMLSTLVALSINDARFELIRLFSLR